MNKDIFEVLYNKVNSTRTKETANLILNGLLKTLGVFCILVLIAVIIEYFAQGDTKFRTFLDASLLIITFATFILTTGSSILRALKVQKYLPSINDTALRIGNFYPTIKDKLGNALQLSSDTNADAVKGVSQELIQLNIQNVYDETKDKNFEVIINKKRTRIILLFALFAILLSFISINSSNGLNHSFNRLVNYNKSFIPPAPYKLYISGKYNDILRGTNTKIEIHASGEAPEYINLYIKEVEQKNYDEYRLKRSENNVYSYEISSLKQDISFYGAGTWLNTLVLTDTAHINIIDKPLIRSFSGKVQYPNYTGMIPASLDEQTADITALKGSYVSFNIKTNKKLKDAYIIFEKNEQEVNASKIDTIKYPLKINGTDLYGGFRIHENGEYHFLLTDDLGLKNDNPIKYSVIALDDDSPTISLIYPTSDVQVTEQAVLPVKLNISDDYGFSGLNLKYKLLSSKYSDPDKKYRNINIPFTNNKEISTLEISYIWDLNKLDIMPEDIYEFYFEVADNDVVSGPKTAKTQTLHLRLPSLEEVSKEASDNQTKALTNLNQIQKETEQLKRNIENVEKELRKNGDKKEINWQQQKQIENILQKHEQIQKQLSNIAQQLKETSSQLEEHRMISSETLEKYKELQKLMQEVHSPELERLQKMQRDALSKMSSEELRKAFENIKFDEEQFKKNIDRTVEVLKRIQAEQKVDALTKRSEELKRRQDNLNKELESSSMDNKQKLSDLMEQQKRLKEEHQGLSKELDELDKLMQEINKKTLDMPMDALKDARNALDNQNIQNDMQQAADDIQKGDKKQASNSQRKASQKLNNFEKQMQKLKQEMQNKNSKEVVRRLQRAINNMLKISKNQEDVKNKTKQTDYNSTRIPEYSKSQADLFDNLYNVAKDLDELGHRSFVLTPDLFNDLLFALNQMRTTMDMMTERRMTNAVTAQTKAMESINKSLSKLQSALSQMQDQQGNGSCENPGGGNPEGSGGSMGQQMQQMAAEQQALNQKLQEMMGNEQGTNGQNGNMSQEQRSKMQKIAAEQKEIQKSMQQMLQEQAEFGNNNRNQKDGGKLKKEMQNILHDMQEVNKAIESNRINSETLERQERILSRLLDASRSINERDFEEKRESKRGQDIIQNSPSELELHTQEGKAKVLRELMQSFKGSYTKDYENIIRRYLESLTK